MITFCPTDCEHDYPFHHSIVTTSRKVRVGDNMVMRVWSFVICRYCGHSIDRADCGHLCHVEEGGTIIVDYVIGAVHCQ